MFWTTVLVTSIVCAACWGWIIWLLLDAHFDYFDNVKEEERKQRDHDKENGN